MDGVSKRFLRTKPAAKHVNLAPSTLEKMRVTGTGPVYHKAGPRIVIYDIQDLDDWIIKRRRLSTSDSGSDQ